MLTLALSALLPWQFMTMLEEQHDEGLTCWASKYHAPHFYERNSLLECHLMWVGSMLKEHLPVQEQHRLVGPGEEASLNFWFQPDASFPAREFQASPRKPPGLHCRDHLVTDTLLDMCLTISPVKASLQQ